MKIQRAFFSGLMTLTVSTIAAGAAQVYNFSAVAGASMQFNGSSSSFQFDNNGSGNQWWITSEGSGTGALALQGQFIGGPWSIGAINVNGSEQTASVGLQSASLQISDGHGNLATANLIWGVIDTVSSAGGINAGLTVNLSDLSYSGPNTDLSSVFSSSAGVLTLSFQFDPSMTLTDLTSGSGPYNTSFSGSLTPTPEPGPVILVGLGLLAFGIRAICGRTASVRS
jgi:hypothetical protein